MSQLQRLIEIDRQLRSGKALAAGSLAEQFSVSRRQIFLDRKRLIEDLGAPLLHDKRRGGWVYNDLTWVLPTAVLTEGELLAFFLSIEIAHSAGNIGLEDALQSAVGKIATGLGDIVSVDLNALRSATSFSLPPTARINSHTALELTRAQAARQKVRMRYYTASRGKTSVRIIHPYHLYVPRGEWILLAFDENRDDVLCFNVARIEHIEILKTHFEKRADFDLSEMRRSMLWAEAGRKVFEVAVHFDAYQARYIRERPWHPEQKLEEQPDGSLILRFPSGGLPEAARWVLGYGRHAQVLEPPELRDLVVSHLEAMTRIYHRENQP